MIKLNENYANQSVSKCLADLAAKGYKTEFLVNQDVMISGNENQIFKPEEVTIDQSYLIKGKPDQNQSQIIYAVSTLNGSKGTIMEAFGAHAGKQTDNFLRKITARSLPLHHS